MRGIAEPCLGLAVVWAVLGGGSPARAQCELDRFGPTDVTSGAGLGRAVAVSDSFAVIGAPLDAGRGSAYVLMRDGGAWIQVVKLSADDGAANDRFGQSVGVAGDWVAVAAPRHGGGVVYLFRRDGSGWIEHDTLSGSDTVAGDSFGEQIDLEGDYLAVGAPTHDLPAAGGAMVAKADAGAVYVFRRDDGGTPSDLGDDTWVQDAKLTAKSGTAGDQLGLSVSLSGGVVAAGAPARGDGSGAVYVFYYDGASWVEASELQARSSKTRSFGTSVSISGDNLAVGALFETSQFTLGPAAYVFENTGSFWGERAYHEVGRPVDLTGAGKVSVAIAEETAVVGAPDEKSGSVSTGTITVLDRGVGLWEVWGVMTGSAAGQGDEFGWAVALGDGFAVVGAPRDDDAGTDSGSAYLLWGATQPDCDNNGLGDYCDILAGTAPDEDTNGVPDPCETCPPGGSCSDGQFCNGLEYCDAAADRCRDGTNPCTSPSFPYCDEVNNQCDACIGNDDCDDGRFCNGAETCDSTGSCRPALKPCAFDEVCDEDNDECDECDGASDCDDGVFCNGAEACDAEGTCRPGAPPCPLELVCDEANAECDNCDEDADCNDGRYCNGVESCKADGTCRAGTSPCPADRACDESDDECVECDDDGDCADEWFCNGVETCGTDGTCRAGTSPCPPSKACDEANDQCDACDDNGDCRDGDLCTTDTCTAGVCVHTPAAVCDDLDGDGVLNEVDVCPGTAQGSSVDQRGCACQQLDDDGDGVSNCDDQCPTTSPGLGVDVAGCPSGPRPGLPPALDDGGAFDDGGDQPDGSTPDSGGPDGGSADVPDDDGGDAGPADDALPGDDADAGAPTPEDGTSDGGGGSGSSSGRRASPGGSTCGLLGTISLAWLGGGLAILRRLQLAYR